MNPEFHTYELIDRYLNNDLTPQEVEDFISRLSKDAEFAETFELQKSAHDFILDNEMLELKNKMEQDLGNSNRFTNWNKIGLYSLAAIIAGGGIYLLINNSPKKENNLSINKANIATNVPTGETSQKKSQENYKVTKEVKTKFIGKNNPDFPDNINGNIMPVDSEIATTALEDHTTKGIKESIDRNNNEGNTNSYDVSKDNGVGNQEPACKLIANVSINHTCHNKVNGAIIIENVNGGTPPYSFSINQRKFTKENIFSHLSGGSYNLVIKDKNNCKSVHEHALVVKEEQCKEMIDDAFMPESGQTWKFPFKDNTDGSIQIISEQGASVYTSKINHGNPSEWDGRNDNGVLLPTGLYQFIIYYENGVFEKGYITILK